MTLLFQYSVFSLQNILQMFERETRREKILEARNKELRLKEKTKGILGLGGGLLGGGGGGGGDKMASISKQAQANRDTVKDGDGNDDQGPQDDEFEDPIVKAEREFFQIIKQEQDARLEQRKQKQGADEQEEK